MSLTGKFFLGWRVRVPKGTGKNQIGVGMKLNTLPLAFARLESIDRTDRLARHYWIYDRQR